MHLDALMNEFAETVKIPDLKFSSEGVVTLEFKDKYTMSIEHSEDQQQITFYGIIGHLPSEEREICLIALLEANLFGQKTDGASIGIDADTEEIFLFKTLEAENLTFFRFLDEFKQFLEIQQQWTDRLESKAYAKT